MIDGVPHWTILGTGRVACAVAHDAVKFCGANLTLFDISDSSIAHARTRLRKVLGCAADEKVAFFRYTDIQELHSYCSATDVIVSCAPYAVNAGFTRLAVSLGIPFCDLGGSPEMVEAQAQFASKVNARSAVVPDCGLSPGISNILAAHMARKYGCDTVRVRCGGNPRKVERGNLWRWKATFSPEGVAEEYTGHAVAIQNGALVEVPALSSIEYFDDTFECSPTSNNSHRTAKYLLSLGVKNYDYQTLRYHGHFGRVLLDNLQGIDKRELAEHVRNTPMFQFDREIDEDVVTLIVEGECGAAGTTNRRVEGRCIRYDVTLDPGTRFTAMELTTAWGISLVAQVLASKAPLSGFRLPQEFMRADYVMSAIDKRLAYYFQQK